MAETDAERYEREYAAPAREAEARLKARMEAMAPEGPANPFVQMTEAELKDYKRQALRAAIAARLLAGGLEAVTAAAKWGLVALVVVPVVRRLK